MTTPLSTTAVSFLAALLPAASAVDAAAPGCTVVLSMPLALVATACWAGPPHAVPDGELCLLAELLPVGTAVDVAAAGTAGVSAMPLAALSDECST